jgi:hypothetical protein
VAKGAPIVLGSSALEALRHKAPPLIYTGYRPSDAAVPPAGVGGGEMEILDDDD